MKLLLLITSLGSGGAERQLVNLSILFKKNGIDVEFVIYSKADFYEEYLIKNGIEVCKLNVKNYFDRIIKIRKHIRQSNCDTVISFLEINNFLACLSSIPNKRWNLITNELSSKKSTFLSNRGKLFCWFQRYSDKIICNSYNARNMWLKYHPEYVNKLNVIYNPVILPEISTMYIPKKDGTLNIVVAASYQYLKNPIGLTKALCLLDDNERKKININWYGKKCVSNGGTKPYDQALKLITSHNLQSVIHLNDATKDIINKMNEADVVALFSKLEGLPNAVCEGMMLGKPIIMSKVSDYETLVDGTNGFLCEWDNPQSIKEALVATMNLSKKELIMMGEKSKEKANLLFAPDVIIKEWIKCINP